MNKISKFVLCAVSLIALLILSFIIGDSTTQASPPGTLVVAPNGAMYFIGATQKRGFPTPEVLFAQGFTFNDAVPADAFDLALPEGVQITYPDGALVKGTDPTVYILSHGLRRPFASKDVFLGLGYSFANVIIDRENILNRAELGDAIISSAAAHPEGTLVNNSGTVYLITQDGKKGIPNIAVFDSYKYKFKNVVAINASDKVLTDQGLLEARVFTVAAPVNPPPTPSTPTTPTTPPVVSNHQPSAPVITGVTAAFPMTTANFNITSSDSDGDSILYTVDWGDSSGKEFQSMASGTTLAVSHSWQYLGDYAITVSADDGKGGVSTTTYALKVSDDPSTFGPAVTVLSPNGGESFSQTQVINISWKRNWIPLLVEDKVDIYIQRAGVNSLIKSGATGTSYGWASNGAYANGTDYKIEVISQGSGGSGLGVVLSDSSDGNFSIK